MKRIAIDGHVGYKIIGALKLTSGALAIIGGIIFVRLMHHDPAHELERRVAHLGLDPHNHVIHTLISRITGIDRAHLRAVQFGTFFYAILHLIEGIALIRGQDWAGYLVVIATSSLIPFEIYETARKFTALRVSLLVLNVAIVVYLIMVLRQKHQNRAGSPL
jgi:uncharacterized membrane protein (DUF2068 family)